MTTKLAAMAAALLAMSSTTAVNAKAIDESLKDKLLAIFAEHPEIAAEAVDRANIKKSAAAKVKADAASKSMVAQLSAADPGQPTIGTRTARNTIVELLDYNCGFCKVMHPRMQEVLAKRPDARLVVVMTPVLGPDSIRLAQFALAANLQGRFVQVHEALYTGQGHQATKDEDLAVLAKATGVDWAKAKSDMSGPAVGRQLDATRKMWEDLDRPGTPHIIIGETTVRGATEAAAIIKALPTVRTATN